MVENTKQKWTFLGVLQNMHKGSFKMVSLPRSDLKKSLDLSLIEDMMNLKEA